MDTKNGCIFPKVVNVTLSTRTFESLWKIIFFSTKIKSCFFHLLVGWPAAKNIVFDDSLWARLVDHHWLLDFLLYKSIHFTLWQEINLKNWHTVRRCIFFAHVETLFLEIGVFVSVQLSAFVLHLRNISIICDLKFHVKTHRSPAAARLLVWVDDFLTVNCPRTWWTENEISFLRLDFPVRQKVTNKCLALKIKIFINFVCL